jgi:hypothetical protein
MPNLIDAIAERVAQAMLAGGDAAMSIGGSSPEVPRGYDPEEASYTDKGDEEHCADCVHFASPIYGGPNPGDRASCRIVNGEITPGGWCRFYNPGESEEAQPEEERPEPEEQPETEEPSEQEEPRGLRTY